MTGILEHIDGRKLVISKNDGVVGGIDVVYLRKGVDSAQYMPLLQSSVDVVTVEEKGFQMVERIDPANQLAEIAKKVEATKPSLPKTAVEATKPVEMASSSNVPKLQFGQASSFTSVVEAPVGTVAKQVGTPRTQKDVDIMRQWAMGATLNSPALAQANDAMALSTEQTIARAKRVAEELLKWVVER